MHYLGHALPISIIYKDIFDNCVQNDVLQWVRANFPARTGNCVNYLMVKNFTFFLSNTPIWKENSLNRLLRLQKRIECYSYQVRVIRRIETKPNARSSIATFKDVEYTCFDKYINDVCGYEYCLVGGQWEFIKAIQRLLI